MARVPAALLGGLALLTGAARGQDTEPVRLGDPVRDARHGIEFRMPAGATRRPETESLRLYYFEVQPTRESFGQIGINLAQPDESLEQAMKRTRSFYEDSGRRTREERREFDPILGTSGEIHMELPDGAHVAGYSFYFLRRDTRLFYFQFEYDQALAPLWQRVVAAVLLSFRLHGAADARLAAPADAQPREVAGLRLLAPKRGVSVRQGEVVAGDIAAGFALAASLTGSEAITSPPAVHLFADTALLQRTAGTPARDTPTALYLAEGPLLIAHAASTKRPGNGAVDRYVAALTAHLDWLVGTRYGLRPWIEAGLAAAVTAAWASGRAPDPRWQNSDLAAWIRRNRDKAEWPEVTTFVRSRRQLSSERDRAYALGLVLAIRVVEEPTVQRTLQRYFSRLKESLDPDAALDHALKGVDLAALHVAALEVLGGE